MQKRIQEQERQEQSRKNQLKKQWKHAILGPLVFPSFEAWSKESVTG
ncbi:hypothetical protein KJZ61_04505 [Candidatus Dependentiae bacterium]|nr:hypothetical protein [Candidatus Dependentiae bacterium]